VANLKAGGKSGPHGNMECIPIPFLVCPLTFRHPERTITGGKWAIPGRMGCDGGAMERKVSEKRRPSRTEAGSLNAAWESILQARLAEKEAGRSPACSDEGVRLSRLDVPEEGLAADAVKDAASQLLDMQMRLDAAESARAEASRRVEILEAEVTRLTSEARVADEMRKNAESEAATLRTRTLSADAPLKALKEERDALRHDLAEATARVEELTRERDEARARAIELETELASLRSAAMGADRAREDAEGKLRRLGAELEAARAAEKAAREDLAAADSRCADLEIELKKARAAQPAQQDGTESLGQDEIDKVVGEFSRGKVVPSVQQGEREEVLKAELDEARARLAVAESVRAAAEERLARAEAKAAEMAARLQAAEKELQALASSGASPQGGYSSEVLDLRRRLEEAYGIIRAIEDAYIKGQSRRFRLPRGPR
jgi:chromosome segregation ATPase